MGHNIQAITILAITIFLWQKVSWIFEDKSLFLMEKENIVRRNCLYLVESAPDKFDWSRHYSYGLYSYGLYSYGLYVHTRQV